MIVFVALALTVLTFAFIIYPLFKQRSSSADSVADEQLRELQSKRDTTYSMLKELEFDFQSGILTDEDYQDLETRYKGKAISILRDIDNAKKVPEVEDEIEEQVLELRQSKDRFCPKCGTRCQEGDRFCSRCGATLSQGEHID